MDMQLAIAKIDPKSTYVLNHSQNDGAQKILFWRGPYPHPSIEELAQAWDECLADKAAADLAEAERQQALTRVKADAAMADLVKVLEL